MSYGKVIGFGIDPENPKALPCAPHKSESGYFKTMGVKPIFVSLKKWMPEGNREPEQKIFLQDAEGFQDIRRIITNARNAFMIPGQCYEDKDPLNSILIDTGCGFLDKKNYSLRYRFEMDPDTGSFSKGDFNEKSSMAAANIIGGCADRYERELEQQVGEPLDHAYEAFLKKYRRRNDPAECDDVAFDDLRVGAIYQCSRNEIGVAFKHPTDNVMFVFEICEDFWHDTDANMVRSKMHNNAKYHEWEFEIKQVWGELPTRIKRPEDFKEYLYASMTMFRDYMHRNVRGSSINMKSKAEIAKENIEMHHGLTKGFLAQMGLSSTFEYAVTIGQQKTLADVIEGSQNVLYRLGKELHDEKTRFNETAIQPSVFAIGQGTMDIPYHNENNNPKKAAKLVAGLR